MTDHLSRKARSFNMAQIKSKNTEPERVVRRLLRMEGVRYVSHPKELPSKPDFAIRARKIAILVHGCFWHSCRRNGCGRSNMPKTNRIYWAEKLSKNRLRDKRKLRELRSLGYRVAIVWECETKLPKTLSRKILRIISR